MLRILYLPFSFAIACSALFCSLHAQTQKWQTYKWKNVQMVGGGFVDGIIFHPTAKDVRYARTDMGGAYRWEASSHRWEPILDWVPYEDLNLMGVESIAVDPSDPQRVYLACGTYTNPHTPDGAILRSADGGRTFQRTNVPFKFGGNEDGRGNGERMAVDPNDHNIIYLGTRYAGLWRSTDRGVTWNQVTTFPDVTEQIPATSAIAGESSAQRWRRQPIRGSGIVFVKYDQHSGAINQPSRLLYVGVSLLGRTNLYRSKDAGATWSSVPGEPAQYRPNRAALASDGMLYISYGSAPGPSRMTSGGVWKLDTRTDTWIEITPDKPIPGSKEFGYAAVAVDERHPQTILASSFGRPKSAGGEDLFRSTDGGATWKPVFGSGSTFDYSLAPYVQPTPIHWMFDVEIDPANPDHAMFTTGYGGWETFNLTALDHGQPSKWSIMATGIEETVALQLDSPTHGAHLISAIGDYGGFVHWDLDKPAPEGSPAPPLFGNTTGVVSATLNPAVIVRVGIASAHQATGNIGYSLDEGKTWHNTKSAPNPKSKLGSIAVSADGKTWIWTPEASAPSLTRDQGETWTSVQGLAEDARVIADPLDSQRFYSLSLFDGHISMSTDGGTSFTAKAFTLPDGLPTKSGNRGDARGGQDRLYLTPGRSGDLWIAAYDGLYHSAADGATYKKIESVQQILAFGFGKAAPHAQTPALYLIGVIHGVRGIFRSEDFGQSWILINDAEHQWGLVLQSLRRSQAIRARVCWDSRTRCVLR